MTQAEYIKRIAQLVVLGQQLGMIDEWRPVLLPAFRHFGLTNEQIRQLIQDVKGANE